MTASKDVCSTAIQWLRPIEVVPLSSSWEGTVSKLDLDCRGGGRFGAGLTSWEALGFTEGGEMFPWRI